MTKHLYWSILFGGLVTALPVLAVDPPKSPPPQLGEIMLRPDGQLQVATYEFDAYSVEKQIQKVVDGEARTETILVPVWQARKHEGKVDFASCRVITIGGERLDDDTIKQRFADRSPVLVITHGKRIDPGYAGVFQPETPVVYIRPGALAPLVAPGAAAAMETIPGHVFVSQEAAAVPAVEPSPQPQALAMPPRQVTGLVANGELKVIDYAWQSFPLAKVTPPAPGSPSQMAIETIWAPQEKIASFSLANCQVVDRDGQAVPVELADKLASGTPILWSQEGTTLDARFCAFLKPEALIVKTPPFVSAYEGSLSCAPHLQFHLAQAAENQLTLSKLVFEQHIKKVPITVTVDGIPETKYKEVIETVSKPIHMSVQLDHFDAIDGRGQPLTVDQLRARLAKQTPVLVCEWPFLDPKQIQLLKEDAIILKAKAQQAPAAGGPLPGPPSPVIVPAEPPSS